MHTPESNDQERTELDDLIKTYEHNFKDGQAVYLDIDCFLQLANFYDSNLHYDKAIAVLNAAILQHPFSIILFIKKAEILTELGEYDKAFLCLDQSALFEPNNIDACIARADIYIRQEKFNKALQSLDHAIEVADKADYADIYILYATVFDIQEKFDISISYYKKALFFDKYNILALNRLWIAYSTLEVFDEAITYFKSFLDEHTYSYWGWYNLGLSYLSIGNTEQACLAFDYSIVIEDHFEPAYHELILCLIELERFNEALGYLFEYKDLFEADAEIFYKIGLCYEFKNEAEKAISYFYKALEMHNLDGNIHYHLGSCMMDNNEVQKALNFYQKAFAIDPMNPTFCLSIADCYDALSLSDKAFQYYLEACDLGPDEISVWIHFIEFLIDEERFDDAFDVILKANDHIDDVILQCAEVALHIESGNRKEGFTLLGHLIQTEENIIDNIFEIAPQLKKDIELINFIADF